MAIEADHAAWVLRVLGVRPDGRVGAVGSPSWENVRQRWQEASEAVDRQIAALQAALRSSGDETLEEIAEFGLNALTGNYRVGLMASLRELGPGAPAAAAKVVELSKAFAVHLESSEAIEVCDNNPFGVAVSIRATLGQALRDMERSLASVGGD